MLSIVEHEKSFITLGPGISVELSMKSFYNIRTRTSLVMVKQEGPEDPIATHLRLAGPYKDYNKRVTH